MTERTDQQDRGGGENHHAIWPAWSMWVLTAACALLMLVLRERGSLIVVLPVAAWVVTSSTVGLLIVRRRRGNPIGWILCASAALFAFSIFSGMYTIRTLVTHPGSLPAGNVAAWFSAWVQGLVYPLFIYLFLLFPDGHPPSRRWRPVLWITGVVMVMGVGASAFRPGRIEADEPIRNPLGIEAAAEILAFVSGLVDGLFGPLLVVSVVSVVLRFRGASGIERQQIKWLAYAAAVLGVVAAVGTIDALLFDVFGWWMFLVLVVTLFGIPLSIGAAVLRYRLYDIDVVINRTLVYGASTALLAGVYVGCVVGLQGALRAFTGQESQVAVVASTLVVAALFAPLRRRVQALVDSRFYRSKYDAARTLQAFSSRLRDETDLKVLSGDLVATVRDTMQPSRVSLWLSPDGAREDGPAPLLPGAAEEPRERSPGQP